MPTMSDTANISYYYITYHWPYITWDYTYLLYTWYNALYTTWAPWRQDTFDWCHQVTQIWEKMLSNSRPNILIWIVFKFLPCLDRWKLHVGTLLIGSHSKKHVDGDGWWSECSQAKRQFGLFNDLFQQLDEEQRNSDPEARWVRWWVPFYHWVGVTLRELAKGIGTHDFSNISGFRRAHENTPNHIP